MICGVCEILQHKYKCPSCRMPYCSLPCWKTHKEGDCGVKSHQKSESNSQLIQVNTSIKATYNYPTDDTVEPEKLKLLERSNKLKKILSNHHVRAKLREVDSANNPAQAMRAAMQEPIFVEFADECMHILEPWTKDELREDRLLN